MVSKELRRICSMSAAIALTASVFSIYPQNNEKNVLAVTTKYEFEDADFTGTNGDEYTEEYLINKGFNSRLEYSIHKACKEKDNLKDIVNSVLNDATDYWSNYYNNTEISIVDIDNQLVVSVATSCN